MEEEELRYIESQIFSHEAETLLESVIAIGCKISEAIECTAWIKTLKIPNHSPNSSPF